MRLIDIIRPGDKVTIRTARGQKRTGRAVMRSSCDGWVLNGGGRHGTPILADDENTIQIWRPKARKSQGDGREVRSRR